MAIYGDDKHNENMEHVDVRKEFKVTLTFDSVTAKNPLEAVKEVLKWIELGFDEMTFDVQDEATKEEFTVDMAEDLADAVLPKDTVR